MRSPFRSTLCAAAAAVVLGLLSSVSSAASLGINPTNYPIDIVSGFIPVSYTYNSTTKVGTFSTGTGGFTQQIRTSVGGPTVNLAQMGTFALSASFVVSDSGPAATFSNLAGSILLTGAVKAGDPVHTLMASNTLQQFGYSTNASAGKTFEFVFAPGTGDFGGLGPINVVLNTTLSNGALTAYNAGYMTASFGPVFSTADAVVPLPAAAWMGLSSLGALGLVRLRRRA